MTSVADSQKPAPLGPLFKLEVGALGFRMLRLRVQVRHAAWA
jgi:hypothetical protein